MSNLEKILNINLENRKSNSLIPEHSESNNKVNRNKNKSIKKDYKAIIERHNKMKVTPSSTKATTNKKFNQKKVNKNLIDRHPLMENFSRRLYTPIGFSHSNKRNRNISFNQSTSISENKIHKFKKRDNSLQHKNDFWKNSKDKTQIARGRNKNVSVLLNIEDRNLDSKDKDNLNFQIYHTQNDDIFRNQKIILPCQKSKIISKDEYLQTHQYFYYKPKVKFNSIFGTRNTYLNSHTPLHSKSNYCAVSVK